MPRVVVLFHQPFTIPRTSIQEHLKKHYSAEDISMENLDRYMTEKTAVGGVAAFWAAMVQAQEKAQARVCILCVRVTRGTPAREGDSLLAAIHGGKVLSFELEPEGGGRQFQLMQPETVRPLPQRNTLEAVMAAIAQADKSSYS